MKRRAAPLQPPEIIYFCKFRPKRTWNCMYLACKIQNFLRQGGATPLQPHTYTFWQKRDWNCAFMVPQIHILLWKEGLPLATTIVYISVNWDQKGLKLCLLARKIVLRQPGAPPLYNPQNCIYIYRRAAPLRPPEIIFFCQFRPKRDWNYVYLACKIPNFLMHGGASPLQPPNHYFC